VHVGALRVFIVVGACPLLYFNNYFFFKLYYAQIANIALCCYSPIIIIIIIIIIINTKIKIRSTEYKGGSSKKTTNTTNTTNTQQTHIKHDKHKKRTHAKGGNCKNECEAKLDKLKDCKTEECTQSCSTTNSSDVDDNCVCPGGCQSCFDDVMGTDLVGKSKCSGCTDKNGYNFDKDVLPKLQKEAKAIGCTSDSSSRGAHFNFALALSALVVSSFIL
jgi:hypothetical protein